MNGFDSVHLAIERLSTDAAGACWLETVGTHQGRRFSLRVAWRILHRGNRPHPDIYAELDVPARRLELRIEDPRTVATLALPRPVALGE